MRWIKRVYGKCNEIYLNVSIWIYMNWIVSMQERLDEVTEKIERWKS